MPDQKGNEAAAAVERQKSVTEVGRAGNDQENDLEAEQESAAAMDADVPQPSDASKTTEGQPS